VGQQAHRQVGTQWHSAAGGDLWPTGIYVGEGRTPVMQECQAIALIQRESNGNCTAVATCALGIRMTTPKAQVEG
jgi:hypothetical protein